MTRFYFIRHGESEWNRSDNKFCGHSDIVLSEEGRKQTQAVAEWLEKTQINHVYASPLKRAVETARDIASRHNLPVVQEAGFKEIDYGHWEGLRQPEIMEKYPEEWAAWLDDPGNAPAGGVGETAAQVYNRYIHSIEQLCERHQGQRILVVGHSAAIRIYLTAVLHMPFQAYRTLVLQNTGVCVVEIDSEKRYKLLQFNGKPEAL